MYYVRIRGKVFGPLEEKQVVGMVRQGKLGRMNEISTDGRQWVRADEFEQFFPKRQPKQRPSFDAIELPKDESATAAGRPESQTRALQSQHDATAAAWYYSDDGKTGSGPVSHGDIVRMIRQGDVTGKTILWHDELDPQTAETVPDFASLFQNVDARSVRKMRKNATSSQSTGNASGQNVQLSAATVEQLEQASTWAFVAALFGTIGAAAILVLQLFLFVPVAQSDAVLPTLGFLLACAASDATACYVLFALWRQVNALKRASRQGDDATLTLTSRRMAEFWRAAVIAPAVLCAFLLLATLLAFAAGCTMIDVFP